VYTTDAALLMVVPDVVPAADAGWGAIAAIATTRSNAAIYLWILACLIPTSFNKLSFVYLMYRNWYLSYSLYCSFLFSDDHLLSSSILSVKGHMVIFACRRVSGGKEFFSAVT
jgi:hypothetical protein